MPKNKLEPILFIPDTHVPYHDRKAWELMLRVAKGLKPKHIVILGDFGDFYTVSSFSKDPKRAFSLDDEVKEINRCLDDLDKLGATNKLFVAGNHEDRLERYLIAKAPEASQYVTIPNLCRLDKRGWKYTPYKSDASLGVLKLTHDVGATGRNSAFKALDTYQHCVVTGHTHRMMYVVEGDAQGSYHVSAMFGWLGKTEYADYMHRVQATKDWPLGFGVGYLDPKTKNVFLQPVPIVNYQVCMNGRLYK